MDILGYLQDVLSGKVAAEGALGRNNYDPRQSFAQNALNPNALQQAMDVAMGVSGGGLGTKAYHYSPNKFTEFDMAKAGSSTDPGLMGRAMYFSTDPAVAKAGPYRYEVDLNIKSPLNLTHAPDWRTTTKADLAGEALGVPPPAPGMLAVGEKSPTLPEWRGWSESVAEAAKKRGHDAAVLDYSPAGYKHQEIAVYDPSIIKILRQYGVLPPVAAGGLLAADVE